MKKEKIYANFESIDKYLKNLEEFKFKNLNDFEQRFNDYLSVSMSLFTILNSCIEIGEVIIDLKKLKIPSTYREIFTILGMNKIISQELAENLPMYMRQRNMIAHQYDEIKIDEIYDLYEKRHISFQDYPILYGGAKL